MRILITNDDGIFSEGIFALADALSEDNSIVVVAPDGNRSAFSHSLTLHDDLVFKEVKISDKFRSFSLSGTPADCVKFACHFFEGGFDMVCSGINHGNNLGSDIVYSGTVSAGTEGNYLGLPAIAFSNTSPEGCVFSENVVLLKKIFKKLVVMSSADYTLNVNFPNVKASEVSGVKLVPLGVLRYSDYYRKNDDGSFRLLGDPLYELSDGHSDVAFSHNNFVTVTPVLYDRTDYKTIEKYKDVRFL